MELSCFLGILIKKKLLDSQVALIERHKNLEVIIETCLAALDKQEQKIIKLAYSECLTNYTFANAVFIGLSH